MLDIKKNSILGCDIKLGKAVRHFIKNHPVLSLLLVLILYDAIRVGVWGGMNLTGYCWKQHRWVSDNEKIRLVIDEENHHSAIPPLDSFPDHDPRRNYTKILYKSVNDFLAQNPDCCHVEPGFLPGTSFDDRFTGEASGIVVVNYKANYLDQTAKKNGPRTESR